MQLQEIIQRNPVYHYVVPPVVMACKTITDTTKILTVAVKI
jgi:hypothetical protein